MQLIGSIDNLITNLINQIIPHNQILNIFFSFFSLHGNSIFIWIIVILMLVIFEETRDKKFIIYFTVSFITAGVLVNYVIKPIIHRPRPYTHIKGYVQTACPIDYSFPSGHAATAFSAAATLSAFHKKRKYYFYAVALTISLSRIYLYCHFFLDILSGALIGYFISKIILLIYKPAK